MLVAQGKNTAIKKITKRTKKAQAKAHTVLNL